MIRHAWLVVASVLVARLATAQEIAGSARPPPTSSHYAQFGVALTGETVVEPGDVCPPGAAAPCILDSGVGVAIRMGYRSRGPWYVGGAYEFSRQDASNLLRLAILQQLRAEVRYHVPTGTRWSPYLTASLGAAAYGSEFRADTGGVTAHVGAGVAFEITRTTLVGLSAGYRPLILRHWTDAAGQRRADRFVGLGIAHLLSLEVTFDVRSPLPRW